MSQTTTGIEDSNCKGFHSKKKWFLENHAPSQNPKCDDKDQNNSWHFDRKLSSEDADLQTLVNQQRKKFTLARLYKRFIIHFHELVILCI